MTFAIDDPFISQWHGLIRFGSEGITYSDLGSTNGSIIEGKRLSKNARTALTDTSRILLGRVELAVSMRAKAQTGPRHDRRLGSSVRRSFAPRADRAPSPAAQPAQVGSGTISAGGSRDATRRPLERQQQVLEAFAKRSSACARDTSSSAWRSGCGPSMARTALHRARTAKAVLDHLLQPEVPIATVKRDLIAIFADFGIHHIAMMAAVSEGVRAMLQSLDPRANGVDPGGRLFSGSKSKAQWGAYLERFDQVLTDDQELHASIFGPEFARAYAHATVGDASKPDRPEDE